MESVANHDDLILVADEFIGLIDVTAHLTKCRGQSIDLLAAIYEFCLRASRRQGFVQLFYGISKFRGQVLDVAFGVVMGCAVLANIIKKCAGFRR